MALKITDMKTGNFVKTYVAVPLNKIWVKCPWEMWPTHITYHETWNDASAKNEVAYMHSNNLEVSFHVAVDDGEARQGIPFRRNAWACGDGASGVGNRRSISVEICYSRSGGTRNRIARRNAAQVISWLMENYAIPIKNVVPHQHWSGKYCPHRILDELGADAYRNLVSAQKITKVNNAIDRLCEIGAINSPGYWKAHYRDLKYLDKLLIACAKSFAKGGGRCATALDGVAMLASAGIINTPLYWQKNYYKAKNVPELLAKLGACS